jgi:hypothetical protein
MCHAGAARAWWRLDSAAFAFDSSDLMSVYCWFWHQCAEFKTIGSETSPQLPGSLALLRALCCSRAVRGQWRHCFRNRNNGAVNIANRAFMPA